MEPPALLRERQREMQAEAPYYGLGFLKATLDPAIHQRLFDHFQASAALFRPEGRIDEIGNHDAGTIPSLVFEEKDFNARLGRDLQARHEAWAGAPLVFSYCYGIRAYQRGTFLYTHVDRPTHIISSAICIDAVLDHPWPLQLESIDGAVSQVDLAPGEIIFYEGARLGHGRPYPLEGDYYAGIFVHYRPVGWVVPADSRQAEWRRHPASRDPQPAPARNTRCRN
jgi:prolyl 4-hydroxylase